MAKVVSLVCDKCGLEIRNDVERNTIFKRKVRFYQYDVCKVYGEDEVVYLCGNCAKHFRKWLREG